MKLAIYIIITRVFKTADNKFRLILLVNLNITKYKIVIDDDEQDEICDFEEDAK